ncbi:hypothetical protein [Nostoc sp. DSM 114161]
MFSILPQQTQFNICFIRNCPQLQLAALTFHSVVELIGDRSIAHLISI